VSALTACRLLVIDRSALRGEEGTSASADPYILPSGRHRVSVSIEATPEWTDLKHQVVMGMLDAFPFFSGLVTSRRAALASMMEIINYEPGHAIYSEGDAMDLCFYLIFEGVVDVKQQAGRDYVGNARTRLLARINPQSDRPWVGEMALWISRPRTASAIAVEPCRMLVVDGNSFEAFLALVPDFRAYLNKGQRQVQAFARQQEEKLVSLEEGVEEEKKEHIQATVSVKWQTGSRLGVLKRVEELEDRSVFAERWERLVSQLLFSLTSGGSSGSAGAYAKQCSTVSFKTEDYKPTPSARSYGTSMPARPPPRVPLARGEASARGRRSSAALCSAA